MSTPHNYHLDSDENMSGTQQAPPGPSPHYRTSPLTSIFHRKICLASNFLVLKNTAANPFCVISSAEPSAWEVQLYHQRTLDESLLL